MIKLTSISALLFLIILNTSKCSDTQNALKTAPFKIAEAYVEEWASPLKSGGSGYTIFILVKAEENSNILLDSVYFRNQATKLIPKSTDSIITYMGQFKNPQKSNGDIVMSSDPMEEMKNNVPSVIIKSPFQLVDNESMVSYVDGKETKYYLIKNVALKQADINTKPMQIRQ